MMNVLFNADDFGLTKGVTDGIIESHINGVVGSATLMMNGKALDYAVEQAKRNPTLKVGIHLVLTWGQPVSSSKEVPGLVDAEGRFKYKNTYSTMEAPNVNEVEKEWRAQIEAFLATGLSLHHIDSHHHVHGWEPLKDVVFRLATDYDVPVRYVESLKDETQILLTEKLWLDFYADGVDELIFDKLRGLVDTATVEVMAHPAIVDEDLRGVSSYLEKREEELRILCAVDVPDWVELM